MSQDEIYLDHAATTPLDESVLAAMLPYLKEAYGNPSSVHRAGRRARKGVEHARERLAEAVGVEPRQVVFTSGATEADDHAVLGVMARRGGGLIVGATEHAAVLRAADRLEAAGRPVVRVAPDEDGVITPDAVRAALERQAAHGGTALVAVMLVNNETGVLCDAPALSTEAHAFGALYLCDAVQGFGTELVDLDATGADLLTLSAHKVYGPKGVGALILARGVEPEPLLAGGSQERGHRPGTHAVPAIVGFGEAADRAVRTRAHDRDHLATLQRRFEAAAVKVPGVHVNARRARRGVKHSNLRVDGVDGETLLMLLDEAGVMVSAGSACAAGSIEPSHVLLAMGLSPERAKASLRFTFGRGTSVADVDEAVLRFAAAVERCRAMASSAGGTLQPT
ncbi:MAG: cysteine desulfurase family protein [Trueperaceae bacterium]